MAVKPEVKERLKADGVWKYFCLRRDELKLLGEKPAVAQRKALAEFYRPDDVTAVAPAQAVADGVDP
ncbi:MAG: hypothetical protein IID34_06875 [Planctomycetes bacterium]|nr:hypothetical protein [Planctomycetota bacterium]